MMIQLVLVLRFVVEKYITKIIIIITITCIILTQKKSIRKILIILIKLICILVKLSQRA